MGKKNEETRPLAVVENGGVPALPEHVEQKRVGFENVVDMTFERVSLLQALSPELTRPGTTLQQGMLFRRSTGETLFAPGADPVPCVIAYYFKEWVEFGDRDDQSSPMILQRTTDPSSSLAEQARQWTKKTAKRGEVRKVQDVHNFVILRDGAPNDPLLLGLMRSNARYGSGLLNLANGRGNVPLFAGRYLLYSEQETNRRNQTYWVMKFKNPARTPTEFWASKEMYTAAETLNTLLAEAHKSGRLGGNYQADDHLDADDKEAADTTGL